MFNKTSKYYDAIYSSFKDYPKECEKVAALISSLHPSARTILDVACGTGEHARLLHERHGFDVDGVDLDPGLLNVARGKLPSATFLEGNMLDFSLNKTYDVVMCLFSAIGYVGGRENVTDALATFKRHLRPDGLIMLEPWFAPEHWKAGRVQLQTVDKDELKICRMSYSGLNGRQSKIRFEYLIGTPDGIAHEMEEHELWLSTVEELLGSFADAGLHADFEPEGLFGRGLYTARPFPIAKS